MKRQLPELPEPPSDYTPEQKREWYRDLAQGLKFRDVKNVEATEENLRHEGVKSQTDKP